MMFAVILMIISNPEKLSEVSIFMIYIFYVMAFFAVFILRRRKNGQGRAYSVPLYPYLPVAAILGSLFVLVSTLITDFYSCLWSILIGLVGLPVYFWMKKEIKTAQPPEP